MSYSKYDAQNQMDILRRTVDRGLKHCEDNSNHQLLTLFHHMQDEIVRLNKILEDIYEA